MRTMAAGNVTIPDDLLPKLQELAAAENRSADDVAAEAISRHLARHSLEQFGKDAAVRRGNMTDDEIEAHVNEAIHEYRTEIREH